MSTFGSGPVPETFLTYSCLAATCSTLVIFTWLSALKARKMLFQDFGGPKTLPVIGNTHQIKFKPRDFREWSGKLVERWGDPVRIWYFNKAVLLVSSYDIATQLLLKGGLHEKPPDVGNLWRQPGRNGLLNVPAHLHSERRKLLQPGYNRKVVERHVPIFAEEGKKLLSRLEVYAESKEIFEILKILMPCSFRVICRAAFGNEGISDWSEGQEEKKKVMDALHEISINSADRICPTHPLKNSIYNNLTKEGKHISEQINVVNKFVEKCINRKRLERCSSNVEENENPCYLDTLLKLCDEGALADEDVLGEINNYLIAGSASTALTIAWTLCLISTYSYDPSHQENIFSELNETFDPSCPTGQLDITPGALKKLKYLEMCIKETLRMFPSVPVLPRMTGGDLELNDGRVIPSGTNVYIMLDKIHRDPKYFPEPDRFIPERHLEPNPAQMPFSAGARNCIGQWFAMYQAKTELVYLLRDYIWETTDKLECLHCAYQSLLVPTDGIHFKVKRR